MRSLELVRQRQRWVALLMLIEAGLFEIFTHPCLHRGRPLAVLLVAIDHMCHVHIVALL